MTFFSIIDPRKPHERRGRHRSIGTVYREIIRSNIRLRDTTYVKRCRTNKPYTQAKGFRDWQQTPAQLARRNANL
jgi:hypothetical protein